MMKYAALIRGIGPTNPNMKGEKLAEVFASCRFTNVRPLLTSGNVVFETDETDTARLEKQAEEALLHLLGFSRDVFIRSRADLQKLVDANPFEGLRHENTGKTYLTVTFFKSPPKDLPELPYRPDGKSFQLIASVDGALCSVVDPTAGKTPNLVAWLERQYGKHLTTRTRSTIDRLLKKLNEM